jgi:hypothetical protein
MPGAIPPGAIAPDPKKIESVAIAAPAEAT